MPPVNVFSTTYLTVKAKNKASESKELISKLKPLHLALSELSQNEDERGQVKNLKNIAGQLVSKRLLQHTDKDIRALVCCCIVDILRVFVPESPFSAEELCQLFNTITNLFRGFGTHVVTTADSHGAFLLYMLKSLSTVRSSVLMVYLSQQAVPGALDTLKHLFDSLVSSIRSEHEEEVGVHMASVLQACIEESFDSTSSSAQSDCFDQDLLDTLLLPLLPTARQENPASYALCQTVLNNTSFLLQNQITQFANRVLVGTLTESSSPFDNDEASEDENEAQSDDERNSFSKKGKSSVAFLSSSSELAEHIYALIYELHKISPTLLLRILPNVCVQLQAEEVSTRLRAVKLLGRLFASPLANYAQEYKKNFKDFLGRFLDISVDVRKEMIECGFMILKHKHGVMSVVIEVEDCVCQRLRDTEWEVRYQALARLLDLIVEENAVSGPITNVNVTSLPASHSESASSSAVKRDRRGFTLQEMAERMKDKRLQIRKVSMIGLAKVYWKHVALFLEPIDLPSTDRGGKNKKRNPSSVGMKAHESCLYEYGSGVQPEVWQRLKFIPGFILSCWGYPDPEEKHLVLQLIQEQIIPKPPKKSSVSESSKRVTAQDKEDCWLWERRRAAAFLTMYQTLDGTQKQCLSSILANKAKSRQELSTFLGKWTHQLHQPVLPGEKKRVMAANPVLHRATLRLLAHFPPNSAFNGGTGAAAGGHKKSDSKGTTVNLENLFSFKDKSIRRQLLQAIAPRLPTPSSRLSNAHNSVAVAAEITRACNSRDDLKSRLDSKSPLAQYVGSLYDACAAFMLINPVTVEIILRYVASLCRHLSHYEGVINAAPAGRSNSSVTKDAKVSLIKIQQEVEKVCQLLVMVGKHAPRSFTEVAGQLEEWLCSICTSDVQKPGPSLWRDAVLSFFFQVVKSVKLHLYCTEVEDALDLRVREECQQLEDETQEDIRAANLRACRSSLSSFCSRALRYSISIGESQAENNDQITDFIQGFKNLKHQDMLTFAVDEDDVVVEESAEDVFLGVFTDPTNACSLLAESVATIIDGTSFSDDDKEIDSGLSRPETIKVALIRKRALCELLGVTAMLRYLLSSMTTTTPITSKQKKGKSVSSPPAATKSMQNYLNGNYETLALQSMSTRLSVAAALLNCFEDDHTLSYSDILDSDSNKSRKSLTTKSNNVLAMSLSLIQNDMLGSGTGRHCGIFPNLTTSDADHYRGDKLSTDETRKSTFFDRLAEGPSNESNSFCLSLVGALKLYTAVAMRLEDLHRRDPPALSKELGKRRKSSRASADKPKKSRIGHIEISSSPFKERLEEEYELTIDDEEDFQLSQQLSLEDRFPSHLADLMTYLLSVIRSGGKYLDRKRLCSHADTLVTDENAVLLREAAGICFLQLLTLKRVNKSLLPAEWLNVSILFLDSNVECRYNILARLCTLMQTHCLHPRFLALPCLALLPVPSDAPVVASSYQTKMTSMIQNALLFALKRLRVTHESLCAQVMSISASMDDPSVDDEELEILEAQSKKLQRTAEDNTPEGIFPYVLYLLSRPPIFPETDDDAPEIGRKRAEGVYRSLRMVIGVLVNSLRNSSGDNIALLLKQVDVIARFYQDRLVALSLPTTNGKLTSTAAKNRKKVVPKGGNEAMAQYDRLNVIATVAQQVLTGLIKTQENVQPYLGDINLPMDLFELRSSSDLEFNSGSAARKYFLNLLSDPVAMMSGTAIAKSKKRPTTQKLGTVDNVPTKKGSLKSRESASSVSSKRQKKEVSKDRGSSSSSCSSRTTGSRRRGGQAVNYKDTRDSDDEEEMEEIEELLSSQSQSQVESQTKRSAVTDIAVAPTMAPLFRHPTDKSMLSLHRISGASVSDEMHDLDVDVELDNSRASSLSTGKNISKNQPKRKSNSNGSCDAVSTAHDDNNVENSANSQQEKKTVVKKQANTKKDEKKAIPNNKRLSSTRNR